MSNLAAQPTPPQSSLDILIGLFNSGRLEEAVVLGESLAEKFPSTLLLYEILGGAYMSLGNTAKTRKSYQKALQLNPKHTDALNNLGMVFYDQGEFALAIDNYQRAVKIEPSFSDAHYNLGNAFKQAGELKKAIDSYRASLALNPNDAEVLGECGSALKDYGEFDQAIECYSQALEINPDLSNIPTYMKHALAEKAKIDALILDNGAVAKGDSDPAGSYNSMGLIFKNNGDLETAIEYFTKAIELKPDYAQAFSNMGGALDKKGEFGKAIENCNQALSLQVDERNSGVAKIFKINFRYVSYRGMVDQTIYKNEISATSNQKAIEILKRQLSGGLAIRIDKIENLSPEVRVNLSTSVSEKFRNKNKVQILLLIFGSAMMTLAAIAKFLRYQL